MFRTTAVLAQVVLTAYFLATVVAESLCTSSHQAAQIRMASALRNMRMNMGVHVVVCF